MKVALCIAAVCALAFGVAFAAGTMTRASDPAPRARTLPTPAPVRIAGLTEAPALPGLRAVPKPRPRPAAPAPATTVASAPVRPAATAPVRVVAQAPTSTRRPAQPTAAASGPSITFFDDGE